MKKSLPVILSTAMAVSMFASVASADTAATTTAAPAVKTSADFKDLANIDAALKAKIDALLAKGFFEGVSEDTFGIGDNMTRAQFAKIATLVFGIQVDTSVKTSSFTDVTADDAANGWAVAYIEAAKKAGLIDGVTDTTFVPGDNVTVGQFDTVLLKGLKKTVDVSGTPWYADAVKQAVELKIHGADKDGAAFASRTDLVVGAFAGVEEFAKLNAPAKVSVTEAKATGVKQVTVTFDKAVDTDKAKLALKKGTLSIDTTTKFSEDKKSAVLTLTDIKLTGGSYAVTLSGLDEAAVDKTTAQFTAEDEKLTKLSFVNASEKIAKSPSVIVKVKAENQYGENATITGGSYTALAGGETKTVKKNEDTGYLEIELNTAVKPGTTTQYTSELDVIPVNIYLTNSNISAQKTFKVGTEPMVSKIELGTPVYSTGGTTLNSDGEYVEIPVTRYDQYGDVFKDSDKFTGDFASLSDRTKADIIITPYNDEALKYDASTAKKDKLKVSLSKNVDKAGEYTAAVYVSGSSANATISVKSSKLATNVDFGTFSGVLATGDTEKYIPIIAYDANGAQLSADDIVDNAKNKRFTISVSGATIPTGSLGNGNDAIVQSGEHKGQIKLNSVDSGKGGVVYVNLGIYTANVQVNKYQQYTVQDIRVADTIKLVSDEPAHKATNGGESKVKWEVKDQYGEKLDKLGSNSANYKLSVSVTNATYATVSGPVADGVDVASTNFKDFNGKEIKVKGQSVTTAVQKVKLEVKLLENKTGFTDGTKTVTLKTVSNEVEVLPTSADLTYTVGAVKDLYAVLDSGLADNFKGADYKEYYNSLGRTISITAKDKSGSTVAIPSNLITGVTSSNNSVAHAVYNDGFDITNAPATADAGKAAIVGNKAGTATITVAYNTVKGESKTAVVDVTVKSDAVSVAKLTAGNTNADYTSAHENATTLLDLTVTDNYGIEYTGAEVYNFKQFTGVLYSVSDVDGSGSVTVAKDGVITVSGTVNSFVLKATSGTKSVTTNVTVK